MKASMMTVSEEPKVPGDPTQEIFISFPKWRCRSIHGYEPEYQDILKTMALHELHADCRPALARLTEAVFNILLHLRLDHRHLAEELESAVAELQTVLFTVEGEEQEERSVRNVIIHGRRYLMLSRTKAEQVVDLALRTNLRLEHALHHAYNSNCAITRATARHLATTTPYAYDEITQAFCVMEDDYLTQLPGQTCRS
jgi:hypothetical protein